MDFTQTPQTSDCYVYNLYDAYPFKQRVIKRNKPEV